MPKTTKMPVSDSPSRDADQPAAKIAKTSRRAFALSVPKRPATVGQLLGCGKNELGQLGFDEDVYEKLWPSKIPNTSDIVDISAGGMHSLLLSAAGRVFSFGCNDEGALGRDSSGTQDEYSVCAVELPGPVVRMSTGDSHSAVLLEDGRVLAWGSFRDSHGNMGLTLEGNKRFPVEVVPRQTFVDISSGADHLVMLTIDGRVFTVGCGEQGQLGRVTARSSGGESRRGKSELLLPGEVRFRGTTSVMDAIWATTYCTFVRVFSTRQILAFGLNNYAQLAVSKKQELFFNPVKTSIEDVKYISGGQHHVLLQLNDGRCQVIGRHDYGRLGLAELKADVDQLTDLRVLDGQQVVQVTCGEACSFARTASGTVYAWGIGSNAQLGIGKDDEDVYEPRLLASAQLKGKRVLNVNSGGQHTLFLIVDGGEEAAKPNEATVAAPGKTVDKKVNGKATAVVTPSVNGNADKKRTADAAASSTDESAAAPDAKAERKKAVAKPKTAAGKAAAVAAAAAAASSTTTDEKSADESTDDRSVAASNEPESTAAAAAATDTDDDKSSPSADDVEMADAGASGDAKKAATTTTTATAAAKKKPAAKTTASKKKK